MKVHTSDTPKLQELFDMSGATGEPLELSGTFLIREQLKTNGATIIGNLRSHHKNWTVGATVLHFQCPDTINNGSLRVTDNINGKPTFIENTAFVGYHQSTPDYPFIVMDGDSVGSVLNNVLIDRGGRALVFEPSTPNLARALGYRFHNLTIQSFRTSAIYAPEPDRTTDHCFTGLVYLKASQGNDYVAEPVQTDYVPVGIDGLPASSSFDNLLIESCKKAIVTRSLVNTRIKDLFVDDCRGIVFERGPVYPGPLYDKTLSIGMLTVSASVPKCVLYSGNIKQIISVGMQKRTICKVGASWR